MALDASSDHRRPVESAAISCPAWRSSATRFAASTSFVRTRRGPTAPSSPISVPTTTPFGHVLAGTDALVHLAAVAGESDFAAAFDSHVRLTHRVLDGARRLTLAGWSTPSNNHAVGFTPRRLVPTDVRLRPDTLYGFGKAAAEALCSLYHDRHGLAVACLRIGAFRPAPPRCRSCRCAVAG